MCGPVLIEPRPATGPRPGGWEPLRGLEGSSVACFNVHSFHNLCLFDKPFFKYFRWYMIPIKRIYITCHYQFSLYLKRIRCYTKNERVPKSTLSYCSINFVISYNSKTNIFWFITINSPCLCRVMMVFIPKLTTFLAYLHEFTLSL